MKRFIIFLNEADVPTNTTGAPSGTDQTIIPPNEAGLYVRRNNKNNIKITKYVKKLIKKGE